MKWECFIDEAYYGMYAVRPEGDKSFCSPRLFHMIEKEEAEQLRVLLNKALVAVIKDEER
jgi:CMP-2-keto-3-deoxyoctulosonic acid synthetase